MKNSNFKKVLALVLSLAMVLSVCLTGFAVSAETAEVDLSYCVVNDTAMKTWRADHEKMALANYDGKTVYRIAPQKGNIGLLPFSSKVELTAEQSASVNTVAYYIANEIGSDLELRFQYYGSNGTYNAFLGGGYAYLLDANSGDILPIYSNDGYFVIPAGFKGYIIYDISNADNYGVGDWDDAEGNPVKAVDAFKDNCFKPLMLRANYTEDMIGKAWYVGDLTVSTKAVEDFAKQLSGLKVVSFNFNTASVKSYELDEAMNFWNGNGKLGSDVNGRAEIVDFGGLEGKGSKFTVANASGGNDGKLAIRNDFVTAKGTDLPFAIDKAKGIKFDIVKEGNLDFSIAFNSNKDTLASTIYSVTEDGVVTIGDNIPLNFKGTVYYIFDEKAVNVGKSEENAVTWADYINSKTGDFDMSVYCGDHAGGTKIKVGDTCTVGGFGFIYDSASVVAYIEELKATVPDENIVFADCNQFVTRGNNTATAIFDADSSDYSAIRISVTEGKVPTGYVDISTKAPIIKPEKATAITFKLETPIYISNNGTTKQKIRVLLNKDKEFNYVEKDIILVDKDGIVTTATVNTTAEEYRQGFEIPLGFNGTVILPLEADSFAKITSAAYGDATAQVTGKTSFSDYVNEKGLSQISLYLSERYNLSSKNIFDISDFTVVYDDLDTYKSELSAKNADVYNHSYCINASGGGGWAANGYAVYNMFQGVAIGPYTANADGVRYNDTYKHFDGTNGKVMVMVNGNTKTAATPGIRMDYISNYLSTVDFSRATAFSYWVSVPNAGAGKKYSIIPKFINDNTILNCTAYAVSDDGKTVIKSDTGIFELSGFTGTVYHILDENATVTYDNVKYSWADWYKIVDDKKKETNPTGNFRPYISRNFSDIWTEELPLEFFMDDIRFHFNDANALSYASKIVAAQAAEDEARANANSGELFNDLAVYDKNYVGSYSSIFNGFKNPEGVVYNTVFDASIDTENVAPGAKTSLKFSRNENEDDEGVKQLWIRNHTNLTKEQLINKEAAVYWVKVPEGEELGLAHGFNNANGYIKTNTTTYNTLTGEVEILTSSSFKIKGGFEGYVIMPLKGAWYGNHDNSITPTYEELLDAGISFYYYISYNSRINVNNFWLGDYRFVDSITEFMEKIGAETNPGDINNDGEVDVRDTVRLKKYNADNTTPIAYTNADIDANGLIDTASELIASRKQNLDVDYVVAEKDVSLVDYPDIMVGFYHGDYGVWDYYAGDIAPESDVLNTYTSHDMYSLTQMKQNGGAAWMYISKTFAGEPVFGTKDGGYDNAATEINEAWKTALDDAINVCKAKGVWNQIVGFHTEEILMTASKYMSQTQYATMTKYLRDTYGKRVLAILSTYEVMGKEDYAAGPIPAANPETYANVTDIGFDKYHIDTDAEKESFISIFNSLKEKTGNRTDVKYWLLPTTYCGKTAEGEPSRTDESIATEVAWFDDLFANTDLIPESQRGGILFYTFRTFYDGGYDYPVSAGNFGSFGLDKLMSEYNYTLTAKAIADMAAKYVK